MNGRKMTALGAGLLFAGAAAVQAGGLPSADGKPLSEIAASLESRGTVVAIDFDDGLWEAEVYKGGRETELYLDPSSGEVKRQVADDDIHEELPPEGSKPLSEILRSVESRKPGVITEVEFDDGVWEIEVHKNGTEIKLHVDPRAGQTKAR